MRVRSILLRLRGLPTRVSLAVLLITAFVALVSPAPQGLYVIEGHLLLVTPNANGGGNALRSDAQNTVLFAAAVERSYNIRPVTAQVASTSATLYGIGVRDGSRVTLPRAGGQFVNSFNAPYLRIEVVSPDPEVTRHRFDRIVSDLTEIVAMRQRQAGVSEASRVRIALSPSSPSTEYVAGRRSRWILALGALGGIGSVATNWTVRRFAAKRSAT